MYGAQTEFLDEFATDGFPDEEMTFESDGTAEFYDEGYELEYGAESSAGDIPFSEDEEMELAAELLEVQGEQELEQFLGSLVRRAAQGVRRFSRTPLGRQLTGHLKGFARRSLTSLGQHAGRRLLGKSGAVMGGRLAAAAGRRYFGLELEGLSPEDQEFEVARRFVRFAGAASRNAARLAGRIPSSAALQRATAAAASRFAPGLIRRNGGQRAQRGTWVRRGRTIFLKGV